MFFLGFHLRHGFWSALQSLGAMKPKLSPLIYTLGLLFAVLMAGGFLIMPIYMHFCASGCGGCCGNLAAGIQHGADGRGVNLAHDAANKLHLAAAALVVAYAGVKLQCFPEVCGQVKVFDLLRA